MIGNVDFPASSSGNAIRFAIFFCFPISPLYFAAKFYPHARGCFGMQPSCMGFLAMVNGEPATFRDATTDFPAK